MYTYWNPIRNNMGYFEHRKLITTGSDPEYKALCEEYFTKGR